VIRVLIAVLVGVAAVGSYSITTYLSLLESGINQNVVGVERVVAVEQAIKEHNGALVGMVKTTQDISQRMDSLVNYTTTILQQIHTVGEANRATERLNGTLVENNQASAKELGRVVASLSAMNQSAVAIHQYMQELSATASHDVDALESISANTARMNTRTPGW
jgi:uncharacterized protein YoxC